MKATIPPAVQAVLDAIKALPPEHRILAIRLAVEGNRPQRKPRRLVQRQPRQVAGWLGRDIEPHHDPAA